MNATIEGNAGARGWLRHWRCFAVAAAFAWPLFWISRSITQAAPALAVAALSPYTLAMLAVRPEGVVARVFPPGAATEEYRPSMNAAIQDPFGLSILFAVAAVLILFMIRKRLPGCRLFASLFATYVALTILESATRTIWFRGAEAGAGTYAGLLVGVLMAIPAIRATADDTDASAKWERGVLCILLLLIPYSLFLVNFSRGGMPIAWFVPAGIVTFLIVIASSLRSHGTSAGHVPGLKTIGMGVAATLAIFLVGSSFRSLPVERAHVPVKAGQPMLAGAPYPKHFFQRGVSFTSEWPDSYDSQNAHAMLHKLSDRGVDAIALVPYGVSRRGDGTLRFGGWERDESIVALTNTAHSLGMRVMLKPQVWVRGGYPGDLEFESEEQRLEWFAEYEKFAIHYAELAARTHADLFCVGTEFARLTQHEGYWRGLIAKVRRAYRGPLTYAANFGAEFENIAFWDALDYLGLNNYYPLPDSLDTSSIVARVESVQSRFRKPVIFTEAGYSSYEGGHRKPWSENEGPIDLGGQAAAYEAILSAFWEKPWFYGAYWWKVGSNSFGGPMDRTHTPWGKPAMDVIEKWYATAAPREGYESPEGSKP